MVTVQSSPSPNAVQLPPDTSIQLPPASVESESVKVTFPEDHTVPLGVQFPHSGSMKSEAAETDECANAPKSQMATEAANLAPFKPPIARIRSAIFLGKRINARIVVFLGMPVKYGKERILTKRKENFIFFRLLAIMRKIQHSEKPPHVREKTRHSARFRRSGNPLPSRVGKENPGTAILRNREGI